MNHVCYIYEYINIAGYIFHTCKYTFNDIKTNFKLQKRRIAPREIIFNPIYWATLLLCPIYFKSESLNLYIYDIDHLTIGFFFVSMSCSCFEKPHNLIHFHNSMTSKNCDKLK